MKLISNSRAGEEVIVRRADLRFLLRAVETLDAEVEQLEITEDWYSSDSRDLLDTSKEVLRGYLGLHEEEYDEDEYGTAIKQEALELRFDEEGVESNQEPLDIWE